MKDEEDGEPSLVLFNSRALTGRYNTDIEVKPYEVFVLEEKRKNYEQGIYVGL